MKLLIDLPKNKSQTIFDDENAILKFLLRENIFKKDSEQSEIRTDENYYSLKNFREIKIQRDGTVFLSLQQL